MPLCVNQSAAVKAVKSHYWKGASRDGEHAARAVTFSRLFKSWKRVQMAPIEKSKVGAPEINWIWCPEDGWIPP